MAVKAADQVTLHDLADGFSVIMSSEAHSMVGTTTSTLGTAQTTTTTITVLQGGDYRAFTIGEITAPANVTVTAGSAASGTYAITLTISFAAALASGGTFDIPVQIGEVTIYKTFSYSIALKGATGAGGYTILMGNESAAIACDKDGNTKEAGTITIPFSIFQGTSRKAATVTVTTNTLPSGITVGTNTAGTTSAEGSLTLNVAAGSSLGGAEAGEITLTFKTGSTTVGTKKFSWAKTTTGATGGTGTSATSVVCGNESASIPCTLGGLVTKAMSIVIPFAGYIGTARAACTVAVSGLPSGMTAGTNTAATASQDGSLTISVAKDGTLGGASVMSGEFTLTFSCNGQSFVKKFSWAKAMTGATGAKGDQGDAGEDAVVIVILSNNGTVFKNSQGQTTLTAHVYQAGAEVTGSDLSAMGTLKWYKDGGSTAVATGASLTVSASDVDSKAVYTVQLEG